MSAQGGRGREGARRPRLLPVFLSALVLLPLDPFVSRSAAQVVSGEAAAAGSASAASAASAVNAAPIAGPAAMTAVPTAFAAPLSPSAVAAAPSAAVPVAAAPLAAAPLAAPALAAPAAALAPADRPAAAPAGPAAAFTAAKAVPALSRAAAFSDGPAKQSPGAAPAAAPAESADAGLSALFDGAKEFNGELAKVSLERADGSRVAVKLGELDAALRADPSLAKSVSAKLVLPGRGSPKKGVPADLEKALTGWLRGRGVDAPVTVERKRESWIGLDLSLLKSAPKLLRESWTTPNRQDYFYLGTKTFGLNLAVRVFFAATAVNQGSLPLLRAIVSTSWYQLQDAGFTLFGQTYMKFIGRMTGLMRIGRSYFGDFLFTYLQLTTFEFLNRLVLGPIGENPLVYSWHGLSLIFANVFMGMISGGPLIPAINKMRRAGIISEKTMMHLYNLASLTMQFGLFASFGYQHLYFMLTTATLILSWGAYAFFTLFYKDKPGISTGMGGGKK